MPAMLREEAPLVDAAGVVHEPVGATPRIVSLVPSITELLCDLGLAEHLVGRTGFCVHPRQTLRKIPKVGGTKTVDVARIRALAPTHVIVNIDENEKPTVEGIARFVPHVVVTHPLHPLDNVALYRLLGGIFGRRAEAAALTARFERAWAETTREASAFHRENVLYLIWKKPWMTVARETYISAMLATVGWDTVPAAAHERYPQIVLDDALDTGVRRLLLSSEPYRFRSRDVAELAQVYAGRVSVALIDAQMTSWYGSRAIPGLRYLADFRRRLAGTAA